MQYENEHVEAIYTQYTDILAEAEKAIGLVPELELKGYEAGIIIAPLDRLREDVKTHALIRPPSPFFLLASPRHWTGDAPSAEWMAHDFNHRIAVRRQHDRVGKIIDTLRRELPAVIFDSVDWTAWINELIEKDPKAWGHNRGPSDA